MLLDIDYSPCQGNVAYKDAYKHFLPPSPLNHWVQSFWQLNVPLGNFSYHSVPDNSVDWIINLNCPEENFIVSPFLSSIAFELTGPAAYFGIRFCLLGHQALMTTPLGEWGTLDNSNIIAAKDLLPDSVLNATFESLKQPTGFDSCCHNVSTILLSAVKTPNIDSRLAYFIRYCHKHTASSIRLSDKQCSEFGLSARQLRRLSHLYLGLTPKDFARVIRFQHTLKSMIFGGCKTAWQDHYYDQPHYIREFKRLSGFTPIEFKNLSVLYNHHSKT